MNRQRLLHLLVLMVGIFILAGCGAPIAATTVAPAATPTPGVGVSVKSENWAVTVTDVREAADYGNAVPKSDYAFLVIDVTIQPLSAENNTVSTDMAAIVDEAGKAQKADGGDMSNECVGCISIKRISDTGPTYVSFVFVVPREKIKQPFKFQFEDAPLIPFALK